MPKFPTLITVPPTVIPEMDGVLRDIASLLGTDAPFQVRAVGATNSPGQLASYSGSAGGPIAVALQVTNQRYSDLGAFFQLRVWMATTPAGAPGGVQTFAVPGAGTVMRTITANQDYEVLSSGLGRYSVAITAAAGTRYLNVSLAGHVTTFALTWA